MLIEQLSFTCIALLFCAWPVEIVCYLVGDRAGFSIKLSQAELDPVQVHWHGGDGELKSTMVMLVIVWVVWRRSSCCMLSEYIIIIFILRRVVQELQLRSWNTLMLCMLVGWLLAWVGTLCTVKEQQEDYIMRGRTEKKTMVRVQQKLQLC